MSEQLANLYSTTLAAPYVAGSGVMVVTSAGPFTQGTFSLTILDGSGDVILIFRVTGVVGTTFSGAAEGADANAAALSTVVGSMLTEAAIDQIIADLFNGFYLQDRAGNSYIGSPLRPAAVPVFGDFSFLTTQGTASAAAVDGGIVLTAPAAGGDNQRLFGKAIGASNMLTAAYSMSSALQNFVAGGLALYESATGKLVTFLISNADNSAPGIQALIVQLWNSATSFNSDVFSQGDHTDHGNLRWYRIQITGGNIVFSYSTDGVNFTLLFSMALTSFFTVGPDNWGITANPNNSGGTTTVIVTLYSFAEA